MASSSTNSSIRKSFKYDVYLSFYGPDSGKNFVDHLYHDLIHKGIHAYKDEDKGSMIGDGVIRSIQDSQIFIIVLSKNYASSSWCLDELVTIMECHKTYQQSAYPVFYDVEPSEVRKQIGAIGEAFPKRNKEDAAGKWREALQEAANLSGWVPRNGDEDKVIKKMVEEISLELHSISLSTNERLIGMEPRVKKVLLSLETGLYDVHMIGIEGMGGVGKTTLAMSIFERIYYQFEGTSFVDNVREEASRKGLERLQSKLVADGLRSKEEITIRSIDEGKNMIKKKLGDRKVLVVLDDVDDIDQLEALAGAHNWFGKGSVIIITTRDERLLLAHGVKEIHHVDLLSEEESISLFSRYAFGKDIPVQAGYEELSLEFVRYAAGLPLALKVLGSFLFDRNKDVWLSALARLKKIPLKDVTMQLRISYDGLEDDQKEIFLDVACFMKGLRKDDAIRILESCGFSAMNGLVALKQKSLITISNDRLGLHDLVEDMGRDIVCGMHPNQPNLQSRLWTQEAIEDILANNLGTEMTTSIALPEQQVGPNILMNGLGRMEKLRCLIVESKTEDDDLSYDWKFDGTKQYFPNALRYLRWVDYPARSLPETFTADNLVALEMPCSNITQLWEGGETKVLHNLRFLDLSHSKLETLDLGLIPNIECVELKECHDLVELHTPDGCLERLVELNLIGCSMFRSFLFIKRLELLGVLTLSKLNLTAKSLNEFPRYGNDNLPNLWFTCFYFEELPSVIRYSQKFVSVNLQPSTKLASVSGSICGLQHLRQLTFSGCIPELPDDLDQLKYLEKLILVSTLIKCLPDSICRLQHLKALKFQSCLLLKKLPEGLGLLKSLEKLTLLSTCIDHLPSSICTLKHLRSLKVKSCSYLERLPEDLGKLQSLEKLILTKCTSLRDIPNSICELKCLKYLNVEGTGVSHLPQSISLVKNLRIVGSLEVLRSCGLSPDIQTSEGVSSLEMISGSSGTKRRKFT